jgi:hypothetical protein
MTFVFLFLFLFLAAALGTYQEGWTEYNSKIWCDIDPGNPIHHGASTYCTLNYASTGGGYCEVEFDANNTYWLYGVGIIEPKNCAGAQYCQNVCWDYDPAPKGLPAANFTVSNGTYPCGLLPLPTHMRTRINGSESALFCSLSKVGVNSTSGICSLERDATDGAWYMVSSGFCLDQTCAYTCLFSDQLVSDITFGNFTNVPEPGKDLPKSLQYDFCALATYTDDTMGGDVNSNCDIVSHNPLHSDVGWTVTAGSNLCTYVCAVIYAKGTTPVITDVPTTAIATSDSPTTTTTTTTAAAATTTTTTTTTTMAATSSGIGTTPDTVVGDSSDGRSETSATFSDDHTSIPVYVWAVIGVLSVAVAALSVFVTVLLCRSRTRGDDYRMLLADGE